MTVDPTKKKKGAVKAPTSKAKLKALSEAISEMKPGEQKTLDDLFATAEAKLQRVCKICGRFIEEEIWQVFDLGTSFAHLQCPDVTVGVCGLCDETFSEEDKGQYAKDVTGPFHVTGCLAAVSNVVKQAEPKGYHLDESGEEIEDEDEDEEEEEPVSHHPNNLDVITSKWFPKHVNDSNPHFKHGVDSFDPTKVHWHQLSGWGVSNLEYLGTERADRIRDFVERLEWIGGTNIRWVRGGDAIWATLPQEFLLARFLKGGQIPPPSGSVQYYLQAGHYTSMAYEVPPKIGHVCRIMRKCVVCGIDYSIGNIDDHERSCNTPRKARCNYMPARIRLMRDNNSPDTWGKKWSALMSKYSCKKLVPALLVRGGNRIWLYRQRCEKHTLQEQWTSAWMGKAHTALANRSKVGAKKPVCENCNLPINGEGFVHNKSWVHPQCVGFQLSPQKNTKGALCVMHPVPTEDKPEVPASVIKLNGEYYCSAHAVPYLQSQPYGNKFKKQSFAYLDDSYNDDEDEDEGGGKASELGPEPSSSTPNGWVPKKDKDAEYTVEECAFCFMVIGQAEREEKDGKLYHSDCIPVLSVLV